MATAMSWASRSWTPVSVWGRIRSPASASSDILCPPRRARAATPRLAANSRTPKTYMPPFRLTIDGERHEVSLSEGSAIVDGESFDVRVASEGQAFTVRVDGRPFDVELPVEGFASPLTVSVSGREHTVEGEGGELPGAAA